MIFEIMDGDKGWVSLWPPHIITLQCIAKSFVWKQSLGNTYIY